MIGKSNTFTKRIRWVLKEGNMTTADLQHWFDRPYATVRAWVFDARAPRGPAGRDADTALVKLERKIRNGFTVPSALSNNDRPEFIRKLRNDTLGLSGTHTAR